MKGKAGEGSAIFGLAAIVCAACCAGPIVALLGGIVALGAVGTLLFGAAGLVTVTTSTAMSLLWRRRRRTRCGVEPALVVALDPPVRRVATPR